MKFNSKICAITAALALSAGVLVGCKQNGGNQPQPPATKYLVNAVDTADYSFAGLNEDKLYVAGETVSFTVTVLNADKELTAAGYIVGGQRTALEPVEALYSFEMPESNVSLYATLHDIERYELSHTGKLQVDGDPVNFSLVLGSDPVTEWTLVAANGSEHVTVNGHAVTAVSTGLVVFEAQVDGATVATENVEVERSAYYTIADAIDDAWAQGGDFQDNTKSTKSEGKYKIRAKVVFMGSPYNSKVEMLLDDGTGILDYQIGNQSTAITDFAVGDVIEIEEQLQNYYGLMEVYSTAVRYAKKVTGYTIETTPFTDVDDGAEFDSEYGRITANDAIHTIVPMNVQAKAIKHTEGDQIKNRYEVQGATHGVLATTKSVIELAWSENAVYNFKGYLLNWNSSGTAQYSNFIAIEQSKLAATAVVINQTDQELSINGTLQLTYATTPAGAGIEVSWSSDHENIASVDENGLVTAHEAGTAVITLTVDGVTDGITITVPAALKPATEAHFTEEDAEVSSNSTLDLKTLLVVTPSDTTDAVVWTSSDENVLTVANGVVTPVAAGTATVTATYNESVSATIDVTVTVPHGMSANDPLTTAEAVTKGNALANKGTTPDFWYIKGVVTANTTGSSTQVFASLDNDAFTLYKLPDTDNLRSTLEIGSTVIVYTKIYKYNSTIENADSVGKLYSVDNTEATLISFSGANYVAKGGTATVTANVLPASLSLSASYTSSNTSVATIDPSTGVVTGVAAGTTIITATYGDLSKQLNVTVFDVTGTLGTGTINLSNLDNLVGTATDDQIVWGTDSATLTNTKNGGTKVTNYYPGTSGKSYKETRFYNKNITTVAAKEGYQICQVTFVATTEAYATAFAGFTFTNGTAYRNGLEVTIVLTDPSANLSWQNSATVAFTSVAIVYAH